MLAQGAAQVRGAESWGGGGKGPQEGMGAWWELEGDEAAVEEVEAQERMSRRTVGSGY